MTEERPTLDAMYSDPATAIAGTAVAIASGYGNRGIAAIEILLTAAKFLSQQAPFEEDEEGGRRLRGAWREAATFEFAGKPPAAVSEPVYFTVPATSTQH